MEEEKRIASRISFNSSVRYYPKGMQNYQDTVCKDISKNGLGFISNEFIPKNSKIVFELHTPWRPEPIQKLAEVAWISNQRYSDKFYVGAKFLEPITEA